MVLTKKFSEFINGGDLENSSITVGLKSSTNAYFNNPWTFLPSGTTAERPAIDPSMHYRLRFNTTTESYEYYSPTLGDWVELEDTALGVLSVTGTANEVDVDNTDPINPIVGLSSTLNFPGNFTVQSSIVINEIIDDDTMATATDNNLSTSEAIVAYIASLVPVALPIPGADGTIIRADTGAWVTSTATFADTYGASELLFSNTANTVEGLTTANSAMLYTDATGVPAWSASLTDGQFLAGNTAGSPAPATLAGASGISVAYAANTWTISGTGSGIGWNEVTGTTQAIVPDTGYVANNAAPVVFTLPLTASFGTVINIVGKGAGGWQIDQNAGQNIQIGNTSSSIGVGGSIASTDQFDAIELICTTADTTWTAVTGPQGIIDIV